MAEQFQIDFDAVRACRSTDPSTSRDAARNAERFAQSHAGRILQALKTHGPLSPKQMFAFTGLDVAQCDRRRQELIRAGLVRIKTLDDGASARHQGCEIWEAT